MKHSLEIQLTFRCKFLHSISLGTGSMACLLKSHQSLSPLAQLHLKTYKRMMIDHKVIGHINLLKHGIIMPLCLANSQ